MKKYLFGISVLALIASGHVRAADVVQAYDAPEVAPVSVAPAFSWGGFYIGGQLGGSWSDTAVSSNLHGGTFIISTMTPLDLMDGSLLRFSPDPSGFVGGIYAGYNFDLGNDVIIGLEQDFVWGNVDAQTGYKAFDLNPLNGGAGGYLNARVGVEQQWAGATRVRFGYAMDRFLPYIAAGIAYGKVKSSADAYLSQDPLGFNPYPVLTGDPGAGAYRFSNSSTMTGWTLGVGGDYAVTDNVLLRLEYRYADYGSETYRHTIPGYEVEHKTNDLRVGVAYKF